MTLEPELIFVRLAATAGVIAVLARDVSDAQARWKPSPDEWSILEVINHLYDEEREDFRTRLNLTLHHPDAAWPGINPEGWVHERNYLGRDLDTSLQAFLGERRASLAWLRGLPSPNWDSAHDHPDQLPLTAGEILGAWLAHDHLHIRQLNQLHWQYLSLSIAPVALEYAGGW